MWGNSTRLGYDVPAEIRLLKERIAMFHFKDGRSYLGEGEVKFAPIVGRDPAHWLPRLDRAGNLQPVQGCRSRRET